MADETAEEHVKQFEDNDNCRFNLELAGLDASIMELEHERNEALKLVERLKMQRQHESDEKTLAVIALQDQFVALQGQQVDAGCLQSTGEMKPALERAVRLHLIEAKATGDREALCAFLTEKSQSVVLTVFEDIFKELELTIPNKGAKRTIKKDYLVLLK